MAGDRLTAADFAIFIFTHSAKWCGADLAEFPHVQAWRDALAQRPGVQKGLKVPVPYPFTDAGVMDPASQEFLHGMRKWGAQGIKAATESWKAEPVALPSDFANYEEEA